MFSWNGIGMKRTFLLGGFSVKPHACMYLHPGEPAQQSFRINAIKWENYGVPLICKFTLLFCQLYYCVVIVLIIIQLEVMPVNLSLNIRNKIMHVAVKSYKSLFL